MLTSEQKKARDFKNALFADRYPLGQKLQSHTASSALTARHHVAMTAMIVQGNAKSNISSTLLAQTGGGAMVSENFTQTDQQNEHSEASTQTDDGQVLTMIQKVAVSEASMQTEHGLEQIDIENTDDQLLQFNELNVSVIYCRFCSNKSSSIR